MRKSKTWELMLSYIMAIVVTCILIAGIVFVFAE